MSGKIEKNIREFAKSWSVREFSFFLSGKTSGNSRKVGGKEFFPKSGEIAIFRAGKLLFRKKFLQFHTCFTNCVVNVVIA